MNHAELVLKAGWYLRERINCYPVLMEPCYGNSSEQPDAIGWRNEFGAFTRSTMIECKSSRADFLKDKNKPHRPFGVGNFRYYMAPAGIIHVDELPEMWGLLELRGKPEKGAAGARVFKVVEAKYRQVPEPGLMDELNLCKGALSNVQLRDRGVPISSSKHQVANLGRGYHEVYRDVADKVRKSVLHDIKHRNYSLSREERELVERCVNESAAAVIPHEGYLRIMNL